MSWHQSRLCGVAFIVVLCLFITGCGSKVNKGNYDKINNGMTEKEVEAILGTGEEQSSAGVNVPSKSIGGVNVPGMSMSGKSKVWKDGMKIITIIFINDKVQGKAQNGL